MRRLSTLLGTLVVAAFAFGPNPALAMNNNEGGGIGMGDLQNDGFKCSYVQAGWWVCTKPGERDWWCRNETGMCTPNAPLAGKNPSRLHRLPGAVTLSP